jgi:hypothetical protein
MKKKVGSGSDLYPNEKWESSGDWQVGTLSFTLEVNSLLLGSEPCRSETLEHQRVQLPLLPQILPHPERHEVPYHQAAQAEHHLAVWLLLATDALYYGCSPWAFIFFSRCIPVFDIKPYFSSVLYFCMEGVACLSGWAGVCLSHSFLVAVRFCCRKLKFIVQGNSWLHENYK